MNRKPVVRIAKWNGNDLYSWAVFVDGRPKWTGLSRREASYYAQIEKGTTR